MSEHCAECKGCTSAGCSVGVRCVGGGPLCTCPASIRRAAQAEYQAGLSRIAVVPPVAPFVPSFGSMPAGTNPAQGRATGAGFVPDDDVDEDAQPERDAAPGYGPWVTLTGTSGTVLQRATPHDAMNESLDHPATLAAQVGALGPHIATAVLEMAFTDEEHGLALSRLVDGFDVYGSELFTMPDDELAQNLAEEYADAIVYRGEQLRREAAS